METSPSLCEPGVKYFLNGSLKECRKFKERNMIILFNIGVFFVFITFITGFLVYKYKGKLTPSEISQKRRREKEYIISKLQQLATIKKVQNSNLITNLPTWDNHPEIDRLRRKI